tara:strand:+ start:11516 stop:12262 length:747 start_codon:yes stop_codon:yes gene_type:complete
MKKYSYPKSPYTKRRTKKVEEFKIIGERCSGTYYIQRLIEHNLKIAHTDEYGHKHFWSKRQNKYPKNLLIVCVVREPYSWMQSFFEKKWHLPEHLHKADFKTFVQSEMYSVKDNNIPSIAGEIGSEILADRSYITKRRFKDIFELRHTKMNFLFHEFPSMCSNMIIVRLEDFQNDFNQALNVIAHEFQIEKKLFPYENLIHYKGNPTLPIYEKKGLKLNTEEMELIDDNLDETWERALNYPLRKDWCG